MGSLSLFKSLTLLEGCVNKFILKQEYMSAFLKQKIKSTIKRGNVVEWTKLRLVAKNFKH